MRDPGHVSEERSARHALRGYLYQCYRSLLRWLDLRSDEILVCEGDEDIDRRLLKEGVLIEQNAEQVKDLTATMGSRNRELKALVEAWAKLFLKGVGASATRKYVFSTTAPAPSERREADRVLGNWGTADVGRARVPWLRGVLAGTEAAGRLDAVAAWERFAGAIEFRFDEPDLTATRAEVQRRVGVLASDLVPATILEPLLLRSVLEASCEETPGLRVLDRARLEASRIATRQDLLDWARGPGAGLINAAFAGIVAVELDAHDVRAAQKRLARRLAPGFHERPERLHPRELLLARYAVIPFEGRDEEMESLDRWASSSAPALFKVVHAPGGSGKTRLLAEWCNRLNERGEIAGFLPDGRVDAGFEDDVLAPGGARTLVLDYAEYRLAEVEALQRVPSRVGPACGPLRVVLVSRGKGWVDDLDRAPGGGAVHPSARSITHLDGLLATVEARNGFFDRCVEAFREAAPDMVVGPALLRADLDTDGYDRPLFVAMAALLHCLGSAVGSPADACERVMEHEERYAASAIEAQGVSNPAKRNAARATLFRVLAVATLRGGLGSEAEVKGLLSVLGDHSDEEARAIRSVLIDLYGPRGDPLAGGMVVLPLEPDPLGEALVVREIQDREDLLRTALGEGGYERERAVLGVLARVVDRGGAVTVIPLAPSVLETMGGILDSRFKDTVEFRGLAAAVTERLVELQRVAAVAGDEDARGLLAGLLNNYSNRLADLGRGEEALKAAKESVDLCSELAGVRPDFFQPKLAMALSTYSNSLSDLGRRKEALDQVALSFELYGKMARDSLDLIRTDLGAVLNNLAGRLFEFGCLNEALKAGEMSISHYRELSLVHPNADRPGFAKALINFSNYLSSNGRHKEALKAVEESVGICRELDRVRFDTIQPILAAALNQQSVCLSEIGSHMEALEVARESVDLYRKLAQVRPEAVRSDFGMALYNFANRLAILERREEALDAIAESDELHRKLALVRPSAFLPNIANSLGAGASVLLAAKRPEEAAARFAKGYLLLRQAQSLSSPEKELAQRLLADHIRVCRTHGLPLHPKIEPLVQSTRVAAAEQEGDFSEE